jgi:hypothetical protein
MTQQEWIFTGRRDATGMGARGAEERSCDFVSVDGNDVYSGVDLVRGKGVNGGDGAALF